MYILTMIKNVYWISVTFNNKKSSSFHFLKNSLLAFIVGET